MAEAQASEVFDCSIDQMYKIVTDYEKYPEFLQEVKSCKVLKVEGNRKLVEYTVSVIKNFQYNLWTTETPTVVSWEFASGDIFKSLSGSWTLKPEGDKVRGTYSVKATFSLFVPGPIGKALVSVNLPNMMSSYHKRVSELYGR